MSMRNKVRKRKTKTARMKEREREGREVEMSVVCAACELLAGNGMEWSGALP